MPRNQGVSLSEEEGIYRRGGIDLMVHVQTDLIPDERIFGVIGQRRLQERLDPAEAKVTAPGRRIELQDITRDILSTPP